MATLRLEPGTWILKSFLNSEPFRLSWSSCVIILWTWASAVYKRLHFCICITITGIVSMTCSFFSVCWCEHETKAKNTEMININLFFILNVFIMLQRYGKLFEKQNKIMFFDVLLLRNEKKSRKSTFFISWLNLFIFFSSKLRLEFINWTLLYRVRFNRKFIS